MVNENTLFKIVQTNDAALSACTDYGNESLIIDIDGGVYLGNNSSNPIQIADITPITLISNASITWDYQDPTSPTLTSIGLDNIVNNGVYIVENEIVEGNATMNEDYLMRVLTYTSSGETLTLQELTLCSIATELSYPQVNPNIKFLRYKLENGEVVDDGSGAWSNWAPTTTPTSSSIYQCVYGTTTYDEAKEAYHDGKLLICNYNNRLYVLNKISNDVEDVLNFQITDGTVVYTLELDTNDIWSNSYFQVMAITSAYTKSETDILLADKANTATTISGYGITDAKIENGVITLGNNTITPLTAFTETDPVFEASAASDITSEDITNWNAKADTSDIPSDVSELTNDKNYIVANTALTNNRLVIGNNTQTDNGLSTLNNPNGGDKQVLVANSASTPSWEYIGNLTISGNTDTLSDVIPTGTTSANTLVNQVQVIDTIRGINAYYISSNDEMSQGYEYNTQYAGQPIYLEGGPWYKSTLEGIKQCTASTGVYVTVNDYAIVMHDETLLYFSADDFRYQRVKDGGVYGQFGAMRLPDGTLAAITTVTDGTRTGFAFTDASNQTKALHGGSSVEYVMWSLTVTQDAAEQYIGGYVAGATPDDTFDIFLPTARYICTVAQTDSTVPVWSFQYIVSDVSLTSSQLAALNSGINNTKVANYDSHVTNANIHVTTAQTTTWDAKQDTITTSGTTYGNLGLSNSNVLTITSGPYKNTVGHNSSALQNTLTDNLMMSDYAYLGGSSTASLPQGVTSASTASEIKTAWDTTKFTLQKGYSSIIHGHNNVNLGSASTVFGNENFNNADTAIVAGYNNNNQTQSSAVFGSSNQVLTGAYVLTAGYSNIVGNSFSLTVGQGLLNGDADGTYNTSCQTVLGRYNIASGSFTRITGNGTGDNARSNCETLTRAGELWTALDVMCGGLNQWAPTHKLSEKINEAPTGGTMYVRQSADWTPLPTQPPVVHLIGEIGNPNELPVFAPLFFKVTGGHSTVLYELKPIITGTNTMTGCDISIRPLVPGDTVMFRNGEMWTHTNTFIIGGQTLEDLGYTVNPNPTSSAQTISAVTLTLGTPVTVDLYTTLSIQYKTWAGIFNGVTWNNEYKTQVTSYKLSDGLGGCYYCTSDGKYYVFDGYTWSPYDVVCTYNLFFYNMLAG